MALNEHRLKALCAGVLLYLAEGKHSVYVVLLGGCQRELPWLRANGAIANADEHTTPNTLVKTDRHKHTQA